MFVTNTLVIINRFIEKRPCDFMIIAHEIAGFAGSLKGNLPIESTIIISPVSMIKFIWS